MIQVPSEDGTLALQSSGLAKHFGGESALRDVGIKIAQGDILGVMGPNGSGKTTLLNIVGGLLPADGGTVSLMGRDVTHATATQRAMRGMARTFQVSRGLGDLTVAEYVSIGLRFGTGARVRRGKVGTLLELVALPARLEDVPASSLSVGQQRRLDIARAIAGDPTLLLLDEPFAGLGTGESQALSELIRRLMHQGTAVLIVEHKLRSLFALCSRIVVLARGSVIAEGTPEVVTKDDGVVREYLGGTHHG